MWSLQRRYIGQTKRNLNVRFKEHCNCIKKKKQKQSAFADHVIAEGHGSDEREHIITLLKNVNNFNRLDAYESYFIEKENNNLNVDGGDIQSPLFSLV